MRCLLLMLALGFAASADAQITTSPDVIVRGHSVTVTFSEPTDSLLVTYRPNSGIAFEEVVPASGTSATWTPSRPGVVALATPAGASQNVSVRFDRTPVSGLVILTLAGLVLFGGAGFAMRALLREDDVPDMPLDT